MKNADDKSPRNRKASLALHSAFCIFPFALALPGAILGGLNGHTATAAEPIALHPDNGHYFLWRGKPTVLVTSGEHYGAVLNLDFDFERYLDALAADGLNHTRTFSGTYREIVASFGITDNPLAPKPNRFLCPWARGDKPGYFDGGNRFDLTRWDDAYSRAFKFMSAASKSGIVVEMNPSPALRRQAVGRLAYERRQQCERHWQRRALKCSRSSTRDSGSAGTWRARWSATQRV